MYTIHKNVTNFFEELFIDLKCHSDTKAYITGIFGKYKTTKFDLSKDSITLLYAQASDKKDFLIYQNLGDWVFFSNTMMPGHLHHASKDYYDTVARLSYYSCYRIINKQWKLYEELADNFIILEKEVKEKLFILT
jgi:hypothetical protein